MPRGRKHVPTEENRHTVRLCAGYGLTQEQIGRLLGINVDTLRLRYTDELRQGEAEAHRQVAANLFKLASADPASTAEHRIPPQTIAVSAMFWAKTRMRWRETDRPGEQPEPAARPRLDPKELERMSDEELDRLYMDLAGNGRGRGRRAH